jgi:hypothetical protein
MRLRFKAYAVNATYEEKNRYLLWESYETE